MVLRIVSACTQQNDTNVFIHAASISQIKTNLNGTSFLKQIKFSIFDVKFSYLIYAPGSNDRGHIVFVLSVCLLSTLTFAIHFGPCCQL